LAGVVAAAAVVSRAVFEDLWRIPLPQRFSTANTSFIPLIPPVWLAEAQEGASKERGGRLQRRCVLIATAPPPALDLRLIQPRIDFSDGIWGEFIA